MFKQTSSKIGLGAAVLLAGAFLAGATPASASPAPTPKVTAENYSSTLTVNGIPDRISAKSLGQASVKPDAFPSSGYHTFTPQSPSWSFGDSHGSGSEQINYKSTSTTGISEAWGYKLTPALQATVDGKVTENAALYCGSQQVTNYGTHTETADAQSHGSKSNIKTTCDYHTQISLAWDNDKGDIVKVSAQWNWVVTEV